MAAEPHSSERAQPRRAPGRLRRVIALAAFGGVALLLGGCAGTSPAATEPGTVPGGHSDVLAGRPFASSPSDTSTTLPAPSGGGFVPGRVTAIGDSVMLDYAAALQGDLPGALDVEAAVSRQWSAGIALVRSLRAEDRLGATVVVALGTNGPISAQSMADMASALQGASRVVLVTVHVDQPWQSQVNAQLAAGARTIPRAVIADWARLASLHPGWLYPDGTHLPIGGPGARALAGLVARAVTGG
ncbi:MAG: acetyltransferase [Acidimicrobiaceae bacterium]|nr:acetyltransferase [Acidimicrobiaceae bacterium]